jgi:hypothetical protein
MQMKMYFGDALHDAIIIDVSAGAAGDEQNHGRYAMRRTSSLFGMVLPLIAAFLFAMTTIKAQELTGDQLAELRVLAGGGMGRALTAEEGADMLDRLDSWNFERADLQPGDRLNALLCLAYGSMAVGNARTALDYGGELTTEFKNNADAMTAALRAANCGGDARLAYTANQQLARLAKGDAREAARDQSRWLKLIGQRPPNTAIEVGDKSVELRRREGVGLVLYLWNLRHPPDDEQVRVMKAQPDAYRTAEALQFVGLCAAGRNGEEKAREYLSHHGITIAHHFENKAAGAPITHRIFKAGASPCQIVIDGDGVIRGFADIGEPSLVYAMRAVVAEAAGKYEPPDSRSIDGKTSLRTHSQAEFDTPPPPEPRTPKSQLPSNQEAEAKLRQARTLLRTGFRTKAKQLLQEIMRDYPGTRQARDAEERLEYLP